MCLVPVLGPKVLAYGGTGRAVVVWSIKSGAAIAALDSYHAGRSVHESVTVCLCGALSALAMTWCPIYILAKTITTLSNHSYIAQDIRTIHSRSLVFVAHANGELNIWRVSHTDAVSPDAGAVEVVHVCGLHAWRSSDKKFNMEVRLSPPAAGADALDTDRTVSIVLSNSSGAFVDLYATVSAFTPCSPILSPIQYSGLRVLHGQLTDTGLATGTATHQTHPVWGDQIENCWHCGLWRADRSKLCARCEKTCFCDAQCQKKAWKKHKLVCTKRKKRR